MHWALLIIVAGFGTASGVHSQADLRFQSEQACQSAAAAIAQLHQRVYGSRGYNPPGPIELLAVCIPMDTPLVIDPAGRPDR